MKCVKCKKDIPDGSVYCNWCGVKQEKRKHIKRANGTGTVFKRGDKYMARVSVYDPDCHTLSRTFALRRDALNALPDMRKELLTKLGNPSEKPVQTVSTVYNAWLNSTAEKLSQSKKTAYAIAWRRCERIAKYEFKCLTIEDLQNLVTGLSYYQARDVKYLLSHLYKRACAQGDAVSNLSEFIELPKLEETEATPFSEEEVGLIWDSYDACDMVVPFILLMIYTGMMPGELLACKKDMVDLHARRIVGAGKKTKERKERAIILPEIIVPVVERILDMHDEKSLVGMNKDKFYAEYHEALKRAGTRDLPPYSCRHTTATVLALDEGVAPMLITKAMRQATPAITERYKHADEEQIKSALDRMKR